jgi:hypothetical protein
VAIIGFYQDFVRFNEEISSNDVIIVTLCVIVGINIVIVFSNGYLIGFHIFLGLKHMTTFDYLFRNKSINN